MKIKICGLRESENITSIAQLVPDYMGFIFYSKSPRNIAVAPKIEVNNSIKKVGVFVNASLAEIKAAQKLVDFEFIQLHGNESPEYCAELKAEGFLVIKAFSIHDRFEFQLLEHYKPYCDLFLFDTFGQYPGGNGKVFNWNLLKRYDQEIPFFLSGGIDLQHVDSIQEGILDELNVYGIDVNSKFEISPGLKDIEKVKQLMQKMNSTMVL